MTGNFQVEFYDTGFHTAYMGSQQKQKSLCYQFRKAAVLDRQIKLYITVSNLLSLLYQIFEAY